MSYCGVSNLIGRLVPDATGDINIFLKPFQMPILVV